MIQEKGSYCRNSESVLKEKGKPIYMILRRKRYDQHVYGSDQETQRVFEWKTQLRSVGHAMGLSH